MRIGAAWLLAVVCVGCAARPNARARAAPAKTPAISNTDPCAMRLHDISGALLLYFSAHHDLPAKLDELKSPALNAFVCPVSHQPYVYDARGMRGPDANAWI